MVGVPLQIVFNRQESGDCSSKVVFPGLGISRLLPAYERTTVELVPQAVGEFGFSCPMNMLHGTLIVSSDGTTSTEAHEIAAEVARPEAGAAAAWPARRRHQVVSEA